MTYFNISVIIPAYNVEEYIEECILSLLGQTYKDFEVIIINDGSDDNTQLIIEGLIQGYKNYTLYNQENLGQSSARNKGLEIAKGRYVLFLDSDDYLKKDALEKLSKTFYEDNPDLIRFSAENIYDRNTLMVPINKYNFGNYFIEGKLYDNKTFNIINRKAFTPSPVLYIFKRDILNKCNIRFNTSLRKFEDELFTLEVFICANSAMYDPESYYQRRYRENSIMTSLDEESLKIKFDVLELLYSMLYKYKNPIHQNLIKDRIVVNNKLIFNKSYKNKKFKKQKLKEINNFSNLKYFYLSFYYKLRDIARRIRLKLKTDN